MRALRTVLILPLLLILAACGGNTSSYTGLGPNEAMFAQMMIPHHEQALEMSMLVPDRTENPEILALAEQIMAAQEPEIALMQSWIDEYGDAGHDHSGHAMSGMLTEDQMFALKQATGREFEKLFLEGMIAHHEGAVDMAGMLDNSNYAPAQELRDAIKKTQTAEIELMKKLLENY